LAVTAASAQTPIQMVRVTFDQPVAVGSDVLPPGNYTISEESTNTFLIQEDNGKAAALVMGRRSVQPNAFDKSEVVLKNDGENLRLDSMTVLDDSTIYRFNR
jgi:hypothetical protein